MTTNSKRLTRALMLGIEPRGRHASGFAFIDSTGQVQVHKQDVPASEFVKRRLCVPKRAERVVIHTRFATKGEPEFNVNNHPLPQGSVVGVHNGYLSNDERLWGDVVKSERRNAKVDSEVIFAMLAHGEEDSGAGIIDALEAVQGNMAVAWLDAERPDMMMLARGYSSPLWVAQTDAGSLIFASEKDVVVDAALEVGLVDLKALREVPEGQLLISEQGSIVDVRNFKATGPTYGYGGYKSYSHYGYDSWDDEWEQYEGSKAFKSAKDSAEVFEQQSFISGEDEVWADEQWVERSVFNHRKEIAHSDPNVYFNNHGDRENAIDDWMLRYEGKSEHLRKLCNSLHAFTRPGDYVSTEVGGREYPAQVVAVPNTFPGGQYLLRVFVNRPSKLTDIDTVLVERHHTEFKRVSRTSDARAVPALTA